MLSFDFFKENMPLCVSIFTFSINTCLLDLGYIGKENYRCVTPMFYVSCCLDSCIKHFSSLLNCLKIVLVMPKRTQCNIHHLAIKSSEGSDLRPIMVVNAQTFHFNSPIKKALNLFSSFAVSILRKFLEVCWKSRWT